MNSSVWRDVRSRNRGQSGSEDMIVRLRDGNRIWRVSPDKIPLLLYSPIVLLILLFVEVYNCDSP